MRSSGETQNVVGIHPTRKEDLAEGETEGKGKIHYYKKLSHGLEQLS